MAAPEGQIQRDDFLATLLAKGILDAGSASRVSAASNAAGTSIERATLELGLADELDVYRTLAEHSGLPFVTSLDIDGSLPSLLGLQADFLERTSVLPVSQDETGVVFATSDPDNSAVFQSLAFYLSLPIKKAIATPSTLRTARFTRREAM